MTKTLPTSADILKVIPRYTRLMKTAISVPDATFRRVEERAASLGMNRSEFYSRAAERYLVELDHSSRIDEINAALARTDSRTATEAGDVADAGARILASLTEHDEW